MTGAVWAFPRNAVDTARPTQVTQRPSVRLTGLEIAGRAATSTPMGTTRNTSDGRHESHRFSQSSDLPRALSVTIPRSAIVVVSLLIPLSGCREHATTASAGMRQLSLSRETQF